MDRTVSPIAQSSLRRRALARRIGFAALLAAVLFPGCSSFGGGKATKEKKEGWSLFKKKEYQEPRSMVVIWTEDTLMLPDKPITRGFGGRIYFYNDRSQAVPVDGELTVYGFDETARSQATQVDPQADKRFKFTAEQFTTHFSESDLGASYSIWVPWDAHGGPQREITLIPTFVTKTGKIVRGDASKITLTGHRSSDAAISPNAPRPQLQVGAPHPAQTAMPAGGMLTPEQAAMINQVTTASATIPTNAAGHLPDARGLSPHASPAAWQAPAAAPQLGATPAVGLPTSMRTTTIQVPRGSAMYQQQ